MSDADGKFRCSLCESSFSNPRDLGKHILTDHCDDDNDNDSSDGQSTSVSPLPTPVPENGIGTIIEAHLDPGKSIIMAVDPLEHDDIAEPESSVASPLSDAATSLISLSNLPRSPTADEQRQKFMIASMTSDHASSRYICLVCGKAYTSRYNIRCHLNMHSGKNVHSCPFCNRFFAHKHVFDSHLRTHTGERPFSCTRCGRAFSDRSNCSSHQKKCRSTDIIVNKIANNNINNNNNDSASHNSNGLVVNNSRVDVSFEDKGPRGVVSITRVEPAKFEPQIVSVKSMSELCGKPLEDATSIFEASIKIEKDEDDDLVRLFNV